MLFYIIIVILALVILVLYFNEKKVNNTNKENYCNLNIDDIKINRRGNSYTKLMEKLIKEKKDLFNDKQMKIMANRNQFYNIKNLNNIKNISQKIYGKCKKDFSSAFDDEYVSDDIEEKSPSELYNKILKNLNDEITESSTYKGQNIHVLQNDNYLRNYYIDIFGNNIQSEMSDYFANYFLTINDEYGEIPKKAIKVDVKEGKSDFIIPNQYSNNKHMTNAYNVDWSRIINPATIY